VSARDPHGPFVLCYDASEAARRAIEVSPVLVGAKRPARVVYVYKPTEASLGSFQGVTGGRIDAPVSAGLKSAVLGSVSREVVNAYHRPVILV